MQRHIFEDMAKKKKKKLQSPTEVCVFWRSIPEKQLFYSFLRSNKDKTCNGQ